MNTTNPYKLFERFGAELEYMIIDTDTLAIAPLADRLIHTNARARKNDYIKGEMIWSNELVLHVLELKPAQPRQHLFNLWPLFQNEVQTVNQALKSYNACLMPTAMHPWMNPDKETHLWPHGNKEIYATFDRIFNCKGHGWSNLQSAHLNLSFGNEAEFLKLHAAIRLILPLLPALTASSPIVEGKLRPNLDMRLEYYRNNCQKIPCITGHVIPEAITSIAHYEKAIFQPIEIALKPHDPEGILEAEWVNARGAIARFTRGTIEIRTIDVQECPKADLAILEFIVELLRYLITSPTPHYEMYPLSTEALEVVFLDALEKGGAAVIHDSHYIKALGLALESPSTVQSVLTALLKKVAAATGLENSNDSWIAIIDFILTKGCLSKRIREALKQNPSLDNIKKVYKTLVNCLEAGRLFII